MQLKANAKLVWLDCSRCSESFSQPDGAVTVQVCNACLQELAAAFRAACKANQ